MRVPEYGRRSLRNNCRCVMMRKHVRAFEMHVGVDKSRSYISAAKGMDGSCVSSGARGMHAGDHRPNDSNIGGTNLPPDYVNQLSPPPKDIQSAVPFPRPHSAR